LPLSKRIKNHLQHHLSLPKHLVIPKSHHPIPALHQPGISLPILGTLRVLPTVHFDDEPVTQCNEVDDEGADRHLTPELVASSTGAQHVP
jgi:hypothetical protein